MWLLWFNAPRDTYDHHVNAYYVIRLRQPRRSVRLPGP